MLSGADWCLCHTRYTFSFLLFCPREAYNDAGKWDEADELHEMMLEDGILPDRNVITQLLRMAGDRYSGLLDYVFCIPRRPTHVESSTEVLKPLGRILGIFGGIMCG